MSRAPKSSPKSSSKAPAEQAEPAAPQAAPSKVQVQFGPTPSAPGSRLKSPKGR